MAKNKKGARGAKAARIRAAAASTRPGRQAETPQSLYRTFADARGSPAHGFTLQDEARNTAHGTSGWDRAAKLRDRPVAFVSAGLIEPLPELNLEEDLDQEAQDDEDHHDGQGPPGAASSLADINFPRATSVDAPEFCDDTPLPKDSTPNAWAGEHSTTSPSEPAKAGVGAQPFFFDTAGDPALGVRSEAIVVVPEYRHSSPGTESDSSEDVVLFKGRESRMSKEATPLGMASIRQEITAVEADLEAPVTVRPPRTSPALGQSRQTQNASTGLLVQGQFEDEEDNTEDAILADYIRNMSGSDLADLLEQNQLLSRDLGGSDNAIVVDDDSESGSDDSRSDHGLGLHDGLGGSDHSLDSDEAAMGGGTSDDQADEGADDMDADIDDAQLAALLAKQEELGLGGDELLLFDESYAKAMKPKPRSKKFSVQGYLDAPAKSQGRSVSASALADAFDSFDLSNWSPSNLAKKPKNSRAAPSFDVSDSELEVALETAWQKDRLRKKEKKAQREELRAQGLLGKHANPDDPRVKYMGGISLEALSIELRTFLLGSDEILPLPPMDASARKIVHEIANRFKIKSKSTGSGDQRRPVLHRTKYTVKYGESSFEQAFARVKRRYFPRPDERSRTTRRPPGGGGGGGGRANNAAVTYREGEVVGGSAPEIAGTNRGRAMLEKMGWMSGMGLGAMDNKGIKQPIAHVVKRTKAGLG